MQLTIQLPTNWYVTQCNFVRCDYVTCKVYTAKWIPPTVGLLNLSRVLLSWMLIIYEKHLIWKAQVMLCIFASANTLKSLPVTKHRNNTHANHTSIVKSCNFSCIPRPICLIHNQYCLPSVTAPSLSLRHVHGTVCLTHYTNCRLLITLRNTSSLTCSVSLVQHGNSDVKCSWEGFCCLQCYISCLLYFT